jgi:apolipoprotein N-acyltransferase
MGWHWNAPIAMWLAPIFMLRFVRTQKCWTTAFLAIPAMTLALFANVHGGWDFSIPAEIGIGLARATPILIAMYLDRYLSRRLPPTVSTLVYPATYVILDWIIAFSPLGSNFSIAPTQFVSLPLVQLSSVTGIWGITFVVSWLASVVNLAWERRFDLKLVRGPVMLFTTIVCVSLVLAGLRLSNEPAASTVKVAGITVEQSRNYWDEVIDLNTPQEQAHAFADEFAQLEEQLFSQSARDHQVYLAPSAVIFKYGQASSDNKLWMVTPEGQIAYEYTKTKSWYPTDSDGVIHFVDTPYGRIASALCFDMDFPSFIQQAGRQSVDIMLVPAFDWEPIKPYHTVVGLFRGVENGFSVFRQVNSGTSMAVDYQGRVLAYQDFFTTSERIMLADLPTRGVRTLYARWGDWFAYLMLLVMLGLLAFSTWGRHGKQKS